MFVTRYTTVIHKCTKTYHAISQIFCLVTSLFFNQTPSILSTMFSQCLPVIVGTIKLSARLSNNKMIIQYLELSVRYPIMRIYTAFYYDYTKLLEVVSITIIHTVNIPMFFHYKPRNKKVLKIT